MNTDANTVTFTPGAGIDAKILNITTKKLQERGFIKEDKVKILSDGDLSKSLKFKNSDFAFSKKALEKIEKSKSELI